eukprot:6199875-Lingulodinium_polyedra.AAC.1
MMWLLLRMVVWVASRWPRCSRVPRQYHSQSSRQVSVLRRGQGSGGRSATYVGARREPTAG